MQRDPVDEASVHQVQVMFTDVASFLAVLITTFHQHLE